MVVHKTFSRGGRVKITVEQPPTQPALQPDRLEAENENLRRKIIELELEKKLGDEQAARMFHEQKPLLPPVSQGGRGEDMLANPPSEGHQQRASQWSDFPLLQDLAHKRWAGGVTAGVILDPSSTVAFLDTSKQNAKIFKKQTAKSSGMYKSAATAAERARARVQGTIPLAKPQLELGDYRIRFAQHDNTTLLQEREHESATKASFLASVDSSTGARAALLNTATRTPRARLANVDDEKARQAAADLAATSVAPTRKEDARAMRRRRIREAAGALKMELATRFDNIYDAYSFFDIDGDWNLSVNEFLVGLRRVRINTKTLENELTENGVGLLRTLDKHNTSTIDVKTFLSLLAWHPRHPNYYQALEASRQNAKRIRERTEEMLAHVATLEIEAVQSKASAAAQKRRQSRPRQQRKSSWDKAGVKASDYAASSDESPSPSKDVDVREHLAACTIQKRVRGMAARKQLGVSDDNSNSLVHSNMSADQRAMQQRLNLAKRLMLQDEPTLGGRRLNLKEQEMLADIKAARAAKEQRMQVSAQPTPAESGPSVRGRRLDDNVTLPMNTSSLAKTQWLLALFDYLCVRVDDDGKRTSKIGEGSVCRNVSIPDTVIFRQGSVSGWYFSDKDGKISKKQHTKEFTASNILSVFSNADALHLGAQLARKDAASLMGESEVQDEDAKMQPPFFLPKNDEPVAYLVELGEPQASSSSASSAAQAVTNTSSVRWLSRSALEEFLRGHSKPQFGILQRLVRPAPSAVHHQSIRACWSYHHQTAEICRNRRHLTDKTVDLASRMSTWEGKPHTYDVTPLNRYRADEVNTAMRSVINHINSLLPTGCSVWNAVIYWKVNTDSKLILLWCSEMQIRNSFDVVNLAPRPYNHVDERPIQCYASEKDRLERIAAVHSNPEKPELWKLLTKHDRKALRHLSESLLWKTINYDPKAGWGHPFLARPVHDAAKESLQGSPEPQDSPNAGMASEASTNAKGQHLGHSSRSSSSLPKTNRRNLRSYFTSFDSDLDDEEDAWTSPHLLRTHSGGRLPHSNEPLADIPEDSSHPHSRLPSNHTASEAGGVARGERGRRREAKSDDANWLQERLERTLLWRPKAAGVVGRTAGGDYERVKTPRLDTSSSGKRHSTYDNIGKCPMPSAICLHRGEIIPENKLTTISYRQILSVLGPSSKAVMAHVLSKGPKKRVGPDHYNPSPDAICEHNCLRNACPQCIAANEKARANSTLSLSHTLVGSPQRSGASLGISESGAESREDGKEEVVDKIEKEEFLWREGPRGEAPPPHDLILRTLLQVQQGQVKDVSVAEMIADEEFLSSNLQVCEQCALLVNRWALFETDLEAQANGLTSALMARVLPTKPTHHHR